MNWIFNAYSNVYGTAMMQSQSVSQDAAIAKGESHAKRSTFRGLFGRR